MNSNLFTRRDFSVCLASVLPVLGIARAARGSNGHRSELRASTSDEVSHACESIHQEVVFAASRKRVYEALTDAQQFRKVIQLSTAPGGAPAEISRDVGGAFTCFGGHILGRHIELVPYERIVQAWRVADWKPGVYSIANFELVEQGAECKLVFDHTGFPPGGGEHLAAGWKANYWEPLKKYLAA